MLPACLPCRYDSLARRVWAARDAEGVQPLYWGVTGKQR